MRLSNGMFLHEVSIGWTELRNPKLIHEWLSYLPEPKQAGWVELINEFGVWKVRENKTGKDRWVEAKNGVVIVYYKDKMFQCEPSLNEVEAMFFPDEESIHHCFIIDRFDDDEAWEPLNFGEVCLNNGLVIRQHTTFPNPQTGWTAQPASRRRQARWAWFARRIASPFTRLTRCEAESLFTHNGWVYAQVGAFDGLGDYATKSSATLNYLLYAHTKEGYAERASCPIDAGCRTWDENHNAARLNLLTRLIEADKARERKKK